MAFLSLSFYSHALVSANFRRSAMFSKTDLPFLHVYCNCSSEMVSNMTFNIFQPGDCMAQAFTSKRWSTSRTSGATSSSSTLATAVDVANVAVGSLGAAAESIYSDSSLSAFGSSSLMIGSAMSSGTSVVSFYEFLLAFCSFCNSSICSPILPLPSSTVLPPWFSLLV